MKPKERYLNYALLSTAACQPNQSPFKEDTPIDLSTKRPPSHGAHFGIFKAYEHTPPFQSPPHGAEWPAKYCFPNLMAKQYAYSPGIFPYLFINPNCLPSPDIERKHEEPLYEQFGLPYRLPQDGLLFPFKLEPYAAHPHLYRQVDRHPDADRATLSSESSSSRGSSSPNDHELNHLPRQPPQVKLTEMQRRDRHSQARATQETTLSPSTKGSQLVASKSTKLRKWLSYPNLSSDSPSLRRRHPSWGSVGLRRVKSEQNLHLIRSQYSTGKICAPKKVFASSYYRNMKENAKECKENKDGISRSNNGTPTRFYRNYRKEVIGKLSGGSIMIVDYIRQCCFVHY